MSNPIHSCGSGPDLVMVPGWAMTADCWGSFAELLAQEFRLHLVDLPGYGNGASDAEPLEYVLNLTLEYPEAHWLGWSLGGQLVLQAALERPERIGKAVVMGAGARFVQSEQWSHGMPQTTFDGFCTMFREAPRETLQYFNKLQVSGALQPRRTLDYLDRVQDFDGMDPDALRTGLELLGTLDLVGSLAVIESSVLAIAGSEDRLVSNASVRETASRLPHGSFEGIEGAGHAMFISHAERAASLVSSFLHQGRSS